MEFQSIGGFNFLPKNPTKPDSRGGISAGANQNMSPVKPVNLFAQAPKPIQKPVQQVQPVIQPAPQNKYLSKQKVKEIIDGRPEGASPVEILRQLEQKGYTMEGYNEKKLSFIDKLANAGREISAEKKRINESNANFVSKSIQRIGQGGKAFSSIVGAGLSSGLSAITPDFIEKPVVGAINSGISKVVNSDTGRLIGDTYNSIPENYRKNIEGVANIGLGIADVAGVGVVGKAAPKILKPATRVAGKVLETPGKGIKFTGESLYKSAIPKSTQEAEQLIRYSAGLGKKPITKGDTALKYNIGGKFGTETDIGVSALKQADDIFKKTITPALEKSKAVHKLDDLFARVEEEIQKSAGGELRRKELMRGLEVLKDDYNSIGKKIFTTKDLQLEKSSLDEFTASKIFKGEEVANGYNQVKNTLANVMREQVRDDLGKVGIPNARELYRDYANLSELSKIGVNAIREGRLKGGFGGFWSALYDKTVTPIKISGGRVLYHVGDSLEFIGPKGLKKFGDFLKLHKIKLDLGNKPKILKNGTSRRLRNVSDNRILDSSNSTKLNISNSVNDSGSNRRLLSRIQSGVQKKKLLKKGAVGGLLISPKDKKEAK